MANPGRRFHSLAQRNESYCTSPASAWSGARSRTAEPSDLFSVGFASRSTNEIYPWIPGSWPSYSRSSVKESWRYRGFSLAVGTSEARTRFANFTRPASSRKSYKACPQWNLASVTRVAVIVLFSATSATVAISCTTTKLASCVVSRAMRTVSSGALLVLALLPDSSDCFRLY